MKKKVLTAAALLCAATTLAAFAPPKAIGVTGAHENVTVIHKTNPHWPVRGLMTTAPCGFRACQHI